MRCCDEKSQWHQYNTRPAPELKTPGAIAFYS